MLNLIWPVLFACVFTENVSNMIKSKVNSRALRPLEDFAHFCKLSPRVHLFIVLVVRCCFSQVFIYLF